MDGPSKSESGESGREGLGHRVQRGVARRKCILTSPLGIKRASHLSWVSHAGFLTLGFTPESAEEHFPILITRASSKPITSVPWGDLGTGILSSLCHCEVQPGLRTTVLKIDEYFHITQ